MAMSEPPAVDGHSSAGTAAVSHRDGDEPERAERRWLRCEGVLRLSLEARWPDAGTGVGRVPWVGVASRLGRRRPRTSATVRRTRSPAYGSQAARHDRFDGPEWAVAEVRRRS